MAREVPKTGWKPVVVEWWISLRRPNGEKDRRTVRGTLTEARAARDALLKTGRYDQAWMGEVR